MTMTDISSIKYSFDQVLKGAQGHLNKLLKELSSFNVEYPEYYSFYQAIRRIESFHMAETIGLHEGTLKDVIMTAKLLLEDHKLKFFYEYCSNQLQDLRNETNKSSERIRTIKFSNRQSITLENTFLRFFESREFYFDPQLLNSNKSLPEKLITGVQQHLEQIQSTIEEINPKRLYSPHPESKKVNRKAKSKEISSFEDMFESPHQAQAYADILKQVEPQLINENGEFIDGKLKSAICLWFEILQAKGKIKPEVGKGEYIKLIKRKFNISSFDSSNCGKINKRANEIYKSEFEILISQVSQKESKEN
jgi:hypothetical protein